MDCDIVKEQLPEWLNDELPLAEKVLLDDHVARCPDCQLELNAMRQLWHRMGTLPIPEPRPEMRTQFYAMLDTFKKEEEIQQRSNWAEWLPKLWMGWQPRQAMRLAYSVLLIGVGMVAGYWIKYQRMPTVAYQQQIDTLSTQVEEMREMMMLSLLENPSATERLRAVSYTKEISDVDGRVIDALLTTLDNDPNVNVRLVTLEALATLADDARVREGLVHSLTRQESPLVQVALADVMVQLQEKKSIKPLRQLLRRDDLNDLVKSKIEQTIKDLS
ncbi:HEAT repeat domain-containing protein [Salmonirosea aquatica]|uniref:HEAT repeat domain-containing protein n=1 Tax=Salmonirosea aquatica TaxID=2654236 RepID=A0A7C9BEJ1_9BACT|nr:HEAT repeat domain-containing protein [Cytophagaceae bacterium SJW1-29]